MNSLKINFPPHSIRECIALGSLVGLAKIALVEMQDKTKLAYEQFSALAKNSGLPDPAMIL